jgi:hypothetical protein
MIMSMVERSVLHLKHSASSGEVLQPLNSTYFKTTK